ncbi:MAG: hypothetical protein DME78_11915 [Verrucomicrobia bacterium]|nr:MAG: hypothetical protein DME78_11915 [Verrucomicrobiota bacterium]
MESDRQSTAHSRRHATTDNADGTDSRRSRNGESGKRRGLRAPSALWSAAVRQRTDSPWRTWRRFSFSKLERGEIKRPIGETNS